MGNLLYDDDYCIRLIDMPCSIKAYTVEENGFYSIYVNSKMCLEQNRASIQHELEHIRNKDFDKEVSVDAIEIIAHYKKDTKIMLSIPI